MKPWLPSGWWLLLSLAPGLAQGYPGSPPAPAAAPILEVCQQTLGRLEPLFMYTQPLDQKKLSIRLVLGIDNRPVIRLTLDAQAEPVANGLEVAYPVERPAQGTDPQFWLRYLERLEALLPQLLLANWILPEQRGYRCFVVYRGRIVGVLRLTNRQQVLAQPHWRMEFQQSRIRWPAQREALPDPPKNP